MVRVEVVPDEGEGTDERAVDADIAAFEKFMMNKVDDSGPLMGPEKAIIKTYIWWKTHSEEDVDGKAADGSG